ncbi:MAG TPA: DUF4145 domain-containing protein [Terracidiphilus sp.]|nr:DUF4145 domain-containing protein [Terracidiphilus sp.]
MKCPHCSIGIHDYFSQAPPVTFNNGQVWKMSYLTCPECKRDIIYLESYRAPNPQGANRRDIVPRFMAFPANVSSRPLPAEVPDPYKKDFEEAVAVFPLSAKASAALSRRNLQAILKNKAKTTKKDLADQIEEVIASGGLPSHIQEGLDAVRTTGNFAAHPIKSTSTGEIVEVEAGEAEWDLDVLESLFDFYFVQPALTAKRRAALEAKLKDAGKPPLKG